MPPFVPAFCLMFAFVFAIVASFAAAEPWRFRLQCWAIAAIALAFLLQSKF